MVKKSLRMTVYVFVGVHCVQFVKTRVQLMIQIISISHRQRYILQYDICMQRVVGKTIFLSVAYQFRRYSCGICANRLPIFFRCASHSTKTLQCVKRAVED